jgi:tetratricopeptide (TPR) repeat protein
LLREVGTLSGFSSEGIFLSYRREDAAPYARLLKYQLSERFPAAQVFMDLDSIEAGRDFAEAINEALNSCAVLVALIGRQWATLTDEQGQRRIDNPDDLLRFEVHAALERGVRVIPVLVDGAEPLRQHQLPVELRKLGRLNALELSYGRYEYDMGRLLDLIQRELAATPSTDTARQPSPTASAEAPAVPDAVRHAEDAVAGAPKQDPEALRTGRAPRHNLLPYRSLIGRGQELARTRDGINSTTTVTSLEGLGGVGKTAIAQHIAWQAARGALGRQFQAVIWVEDRDGDLTLDKLIDTVARVIEFPYIRALKGEQKQVQVIRQLEQMPSLLIIDNYETIQDSKVPAFLDILPSPQTKAVITTRERLVDNVWAVEIGGLPRSDADTLLIQEATRLEVSSVLNAPAALAERFFQITEGNPLAIRLSVGQIHQGTASFGDIVMTLQDAGRGELFATIFQRTWNQVLLNDDYARRVLTVMALHSSSVSRVALEAGADVHGNSLTNAIKRLVELSLLDVYETTRLTALRYKIHPLTRSFARHQGVSEAEMVSELEKRLTEYYLIYATRYEGTYNSVENIRALEQERTNLLSFAGRSYERAVTLGDPADWLSVIRYAETLAAYLWGRGYWRDQLNLCGHAVEAAKALDDVLEVSRQHALIGRVYLWLGDTAAAKEHLSQSELAVRDDPDERVNSVPRRLHAQIASREGDYELAHALLREVLNYAPLTVDDEGRAATLIELGVLAERQGAWTEAKSYFEEALKLDEQLATLEGQAVSLSHLGNAQFAMTKYSEAEHSYRRGLDLAAQVDRLSTKGRCQYGLAQVYMATGDMGTCREYATAAVESFTRLGMRDMAEEAHTLAVRAQMLDGGLDGDE